MILYRRARRFSSTQTVNIENEIHMSAQQTREGAKASRSLFSNAKICEASTCQKSSVSRQLSLLSLLPRYIKPCMRHGFKDKHGLFAYLHQRSAAFNHGGRL